MVLARFHPATKRAIQGFPKEVRLALGKAIFTLQLGKRLEMPISKPVGQVGKGVEEIRIKDNSGLYRVFYFTRIKNSIIIFHAFRKKTQKIPQKEIETGKQRLKEMLDDYKEEE